MVLITTCTQHPKEKVVHPFFDTTIQGEVLDIKEKVCINQLRVYDTVLLCIMNQRCCEKAVQLFSIKRHTRIACFGKKGNGPGEFYLPILMPSGSYPDGIANDLSFWIQDVNHKKFKLFQLQEVMKGNYLPEKTIFIEPGLLDGYELNFINKEKVMGEDHQMGKGLYFSYDFSTKERKWVDYFPRPDNTFIPKEKIPIIYTVRIRYNKTLQTTVVAYRFFNRIGFYDNSNRLISNIIIGDPVIPNFSQKTRFFVPDNVKTYFISLYLTEKYVYGLMADATQEKILEEPGAIKSKVIILDWKGNLIKALRLDKSINGFTIDEKNQMLYGVVSTQEGFSYIYSYKYDF